VKHHLADWEVRDENGGDGNDDAGLAEIRAAVSGLTTTIEGRLGGLDTALTEIRGRLDRAETALRRPGGGGGGGGGGSQEERQQQAAVETRAFGTFLRRGREQLGADELRSLRVSDDTAGGFLAPEQFLAELQRDLVLFSPIRRIARVSPIAGAAAVHPKRTGRMTAQWVGETSPRPETTVTFGQNRYEVREIAAYVDVSNAMLEDSAFDVAAELAFEFSEEFGRLEGTAFVNGSGNLQPAGFMANADIAYTPGGHASTLTADGLIDLFHAVPEAYRSMGTWVMNAATVAAARKLKDGTTGAYLLITGGIANAPQTTLLGRPVVEAPDMPNVGAGNFPIAFGDFRQGYRIFDRLALSILRDPYSQAANGMTRFHGRRRVAAGVAKAEAVRKLRIATS
jgi:HK97 family phage major capsid protein